MEQTISEWTLGVFSAPDRRLNTALNTAASTCRREMMAEASMKAYSKSELRASSCECRNWALDTSRKRVACMLWVAGTCSSLIDSNAIMLVLVR